MSEDSFTDYKDGNIVWVKLGPSWWPGEVIDLNSLPSDGIEFKKPPLVVVKFFEETTYEYVRNWSHIYPYNCERKSEFIKKGMAAFRSKAPHMEKFPKDVTTAEVKEGGNPNILSEAAYRPEKKINYVAEVFGTPSPKKNQKDSHKKSRSSNKFNPKDFAHITHRRFLGLDDYKAYICIQYPGKDRIPGDSEDEEVIRINTEPEQEYNCHSCPYSTKRLEVMILHTKSHIQGVYVSSPRRKRPITARPRKKEYTKKRVCNYSDESSNDEDFLDAPKEKKRKTKVATSPRKSTKITIDEAKPKPPTDIRNDLLAEWEDSDDELETSILGDSMLDNEPLDKTEDSKLDESNDMSDKNSLIGMRDSENDNKELSEVESEPSAAKTNSKEICKPHMDKETQEAIKSCFDFDEDDEEEDQSLMNTAVAIGRKIPRVIPPTEKRKSEILEDIIDLEEGINKEDILKESQSFNEKTPDKEKEELENAFKDLMDTTSVPKLPEVENSLKPTQNFHCVKTIKFPDKPDESPKKDREKPSTNVPINPKKRFVKSFEDFENQLQQKEIRRKEKEEEDRRIMNTIVEKTTIDPEVTQESTFSQKNSSLTEGKGGNTFFPDETEKKNTHTSDSSEDESGIDFNKLQTTIMTKIIEEAKITVESKERIMAKMKRKSNTERRATPESRCLRSRSGDNATDKSTSDENERSVKVPFKKSRWPRRTSYPERNQDEAGKSNENISLPIKINKNIISELTNKDESDSNEQTEANNILENENFDKSETTKTFESKTAEIGLGEQFEESHTQNSENDTCIVRKETIEEKSIIEKPSEGSSIPIGTHESPLEVFTEEISSEEQTRNESMEDESTAEVLTQLVSSELHTESLSVGDIPCEHKIDSESSQHKTRETPLEDGNIIPDENSSKLILNSGSTMTVPETEQNENQASSKELNMNNDDSNIEITQPDQLCASPEQSEVVLPLGLVVQDSESPHKPNKRRKSRRKSSKYSARKRRKNSQDDNVTEEENNSQASCKNMERINEDSVEQEPEKNEDVENTDEINEDSLKQEPVNNEDVKNTDKMNEDSLEGELFVKNREEHNARIVDTENNLQEGTRSDLYPIEVDNQVVDSVEEETIFEVTIEQESSKLNSDAETDKNESDEIIEEPAGADGLTIEEDSLTKNITENHPSAGKAELIYEQHVTSAESDKLDPEKEIMHEEIRSDIHIESCENEDVNTLSMAEVEAKVDQKAPIETDVIQDHIVEERGKKNLTENEKLETLYQTELQVGNSVSSETEQKKDLFTEECTTEEKMETEYQKEFKGEEDNKSINEYSFMTGENLTDDPKIIKYSEGIQKEEMHEKGNIKDNFTTQQRNDDEETILAKDQATGHLVDEDSKFVKILNEHGIESEQNIISKEPPIIELEKEVVDEPSEVTEEKCAAEIAELSLKDKSVMPDAAQEEYISDVSKESEECVSKVISVESIASEEQLTDHQQIVMEEMPKAAQEFISTVLNESEECVSKVISVGRIASEEQLTDQQQIVMEEMPKAAQEYISHVTKESEECISEVITERNIVSEEQLMDQHHIVRREELVKTQQTVVKEHEITNLVTDQPTLTEEDVSTEEPIKNGKDETETNLSDDLIPNNAEEVDKPSVENDTNTESNADTFDFEKFQEIPADTITKTKFESKPDQKTFNDTPVDDEDEKLTDLVSDILQKLSQDESEKNPEDLEIEESKMKTSEENSSQTQDDANSNENKLKGIIEKSEEEPEHSKEVEIQCASTSEDSFKFSIQTNLSNLSRSEEISAIALATLSTMKSDLESSDTNSNISTDVAPKSDSNFPEKLSETEMVAIEGNLTVMSEKDLADAQVEITTDKVISSKKPVMLSNFSMDFSDSTSDSGSLNETSNEAVKFVDFDSKGTEFTSKAMTKEIKPKVSMKKTNAYDQCELLNILEGNNDPDKKIVAFQTPTKSYSGDIMDFEECIPSQIVCTKQFKQGIDDEMKKKDQISVISTTSKLLERLTDGKKLENKNEVTSDSPPNIRNQKNKPKPIILSEQIIKPAAAEAKKVHPSTISTVNDIEDVEAFVIHKDLKKNVEPEETKTVPVKAIRKSRAKPLGKAKILQQTIITPAGEILQPALSLAKKKVDSSNAVSSNQTQLTADTTASSIINTKPKVSATVVSDIKTDTNIQDDNIFDIFNMPIVLSDQILTPESIENMPIVIDPESSVSKPAQNMIATPTTKTPVNKLVAKVAVTASATGISAKASNLTSKVQKHRILQTLTTKSALSTSALSSVTKPGKYILVSQGSAGIPQTKYPPKKALMRKTTLPVAMGSKVVNQQEVTGNKIMVVTNHQGQQQRLLLTPAQQKVLGYQSPSGPKIAKTIVKTNVLQKNLLTPLSKTEAGSSKIPTLGQKVITQLATGTPTSRTVKSLTKSKIISNQKVVPARSKTAKTILITNKHGQTIKKIATTEDDIDKQVAEQLEAIKASSGMQFGSQLKSDIPNTKTLSRTQVRKITKKVESKPRIATVLSRTDPPPLVSTSKKPLPITPEPAKINLEEPQRERPLNQLVIQDALGNQTTITEGQILALPSETVDGQPQSYMLVTLDQSGNLTPLNNEALMSLDPNLGLGGDLSNMVLQIDQGSLGAGSVDQPMPLAQPATVKLTNPGEELQAGTSKIDIPRARAPVALPVANDVPNIDQKIHQNLLATPTEASVNVESIVSNSNGEQGQQLIVTGDPIATQKFLESLTEGTTDLANIIANAEGKSIFIQADGQQILINTNSDNQMLTNVAESTEGGGNPIFATQPNKNTDILAAALADTDVFTSQPKISSQLSPNNALFPIHVGNVLETSLTLSSPIMTPLEVPSTNNKKIPDDEADILTQVPKNVDLPITITDPNISQTVANQQVATLIANELHTNLELGLGISETTISTVSSGLTSPGYSFSLPTLDENDISHKSFNSSMPLLNDDVEDSSRNEKPQDKDGNKPEDNLNSERFLEEESRFTLGGGMCSSLSEPPPEMFDIPEVNSYEEKNGNIPLSLQSTPDPKDDDTTDVSIQAESSSEGSCEIPLQPNIVAKSVDLSEVSEM